MRCTASATLVLALLMSGGGFSRLSAAEEAAVHGAAAREDQLKAAYLLNFLKFVEWPSAAVGEPLTICFLGTAGMREAIEAGIEGKRVGARPLAVREIEEPGKIDACNVLYVDEKRAVTSQFALPEAALPLLTVSDAKEFAHNGGIIELYTDANHLRFIINVDNARRAGLHISSSLLQLAAAVEPARRPP